MSKSHSPTRGLPAPGHPAYGSALALVPLTVLATSAVADTESGLAGSLYNVARTVGGALGLAIMSTLAASQTTSLLHGGATDPLAARVSGYHVAFLAAAVMVAIGAALPALLLRRRRTGQVEEPIAQPDLDGADSQFPGSAVGLRTARSA
jgi:hypothetical protein